MNNEEIQKILSAPFPYENIEWRVQNTNSDKTRGMAVAYITSRAIQKRLDEAVGPYNWKTEYKPWHTINSKPSQICGLSIFDEAKKEWITKWDGAENTDIESVKGGISDAFKRAAVLWGIGRYLYSIDSVWVEIEPCGKSYKIKESEQKRLDKQYFASFQKPSDKAPTVKKEEQTPQFDYVVKSVEIKRTSTVITMIKPNSKSEVVAFVQGKPAEIAEGICLKDVKITHREQNGNIPAYNTIDSYKIAS